MTQTLFVRCTPGLEGVLADELVELAALQAPSVRVDRSTGGVALTGPTGSYEWVNLWSRIASRVWLAVAHLTSPKDLASLSLEAWGSQFDVEVAGDGLGPWQDAVRRLARRLALPGDLKGEGEPPKIQLSHHRGECTVSVDTTGQLLHFRGYRQEVGRAPLRETLAAALLRWASWQPGEPLWDVMCGSGTVILEAAEQTLGLAPGRGRAFAFEAFPSHVAQRWAERPRTTQARQSALWGSDVNAGALGTARRNAERAGVLNALRLERIDATALTPRSGPGLVVANLPYGKRVGDRHELPKLYRSVGKSLRRSCAGWRFAFLVRQGDAQHLGLAVDRRLEVHNGGLRCEMIAGQLEGRDATY